jgi:anti-sigma regulatory factor (Ser/Thr protein kinase)
MKGEEITLTLPRDRRFAGVAHLVVGGLASRLNLTLEGLDDIELALDGLLERAGGADELTISVVAEDEVLRARIGPFRDPRLREELSELGEALDLRRILEAVVDSFSVQGREDGDWVELRKTVSGRTGSD